MNEMKICYKCQHICVVMAEPGYSEYTPGTDFSMECLKGRWSFGDEGKSDYHGPQELHRCLSMAEDCKHYKPFLWAEALE